MRSPSLDKVVGYLIERPATARGLLLQPLPGGCWVDTFSGNNQPDGDVDIWEVHDDW